MKQAIFSFAFFVLSVFMLSCKKDKTVSDAPATSLSGTWKGQYGYYNYNDTYYYSFELSSGGILKEINNYGVIVGEGTWKMNGNSFTATYKSSGSAGKMYSVAATYDPALKKLTGTWGKGTALDEGEWFMMKQ